MNTASKSHETPEHNENCLQAGQQLSADWTLMRLGEQGVLSLEQWLEQEAAAVRDAAAKEGNEKAVGGGGTGGFRVGVDPWLLSAGTARSLTSKLTKNGGCLVPISG